MPHREQVWRDGEQAAWETYQRRGYRLVARNWHCPLGELDLVVVRDGVLVFCEVKSRRTGRLGGGHEAVTPAKQHKLRLVAEAFLQVAHPAVSRCRFDVASVTWDTRGLPEVHLFEDAF